jgi:GT2 family glycosyltransferase
MSAQTSQIPVAVVILNWNGKKYLQQFLPFLLKSTYPGLKVYVADNGSTDNSIDFLKQSYPNVIIIDNQKNYGFAGGYNLALQSVPEEYIVLLNSDIEVTPEWIEPAIALFESDPTIGAVQPKILDYKNKQSFEYAGAAGGWIDRLGYPFSKGRIFDILEMDNGQYDQTEEIFWASGAAMFVRKSAFMKAGGFDTFFFAHQEEIDLCWRMQNAGYKIVSCPGSIVYHIGGGTLSKDNPKKIYLNFRNNLIMLWKNLSMAEIMWIIPVRFALDAISAWKNLLSGQPSFFTAIMKAHFSFFGWFIKGRKSAKCYTNYNIQPKGVYKGSVVWDHFVKGKSKFSEIILTRN